METELGKDRTLENKRVYHLCKLVPVFLGRRATDKRFVKALSQRKRKGHCLVLHLAPGERRPSPGKLRMFDHVADACDLGSFYEPLDTFAREYSIFGVTFANSDCALTFNTLNGSQQYTGAREAGGKLIEELISGKAGLEMIQSLGEGWSKLQIRWNAEAGWRSLHKEKGWGDSMCIWVAVGDSGTSKEDCRRNISLKDTSAKEVQRVTKALQEGRPWLARCSGRGGRRTVDRGHSC